VTSGGGVDADADLDMRSRPPLFMATSVDSIHGDEISMLLVGVLAGVSLFLLVAARSSHVEASPGTESTRAR
jgi:hypothetical protein